MHRLWSTFLMVCSALLLPSCTQGQIEQVLQSKTQDMISGPCPSGMGLLSSAPEFCLYVTELRVTQDTEADVNLTIVNRTGRRIYLKIPSRPSLSDSSGTKWEDRSTTGIGSFTSGGNPLPLDPNVNSPITIGFRQRGQIVPPDLTFSMTGELMVFKADSRGEMIRQVQPMATRGFQFSGIRQGQQQAPQPTSQPSSQSQLQPSSQSQAASTNPAKQNSPSTEFSQLSGFDAGAAIPTAASANPDIVGLRLGMTPEEIRQGMLAHDKTFRIKEVKASLQGSNTSFVSEIIGGLERRLPVGPLDSIGVHFPPPPHKSQAIFVYRSKAFEATELPLVTAIKEALIKKYGTPSYIAETGYEIYLEWAYNPSGTKITDNFREQRCIRLGFPDPNNMENVFFGKMESKGCGVTILATIFRKEMTRGGTGQLATNFGVYIIDDSAFPAMRSATASFVDTTVRDSAKNVGVPKF